MFRFGKGRKAQQRRLILEQLESRSVLSSFAMGGAVHTHPQDHEVEHHASTAIHSHASVATVAAPHVVQQSQIAAKSSSEKESGEGDSGESEGNEMKFSATLSDPTGASAATGTAKFSSEQENGTSATTFSVNVKGATPGANLDVAIDGFTVGTITADANGNGSLILSSNPKNSKASLLPANFPTVKDGSVVTIGSLKGTLTTSQQTGSGDSHEKGD